MILSPYAPHSVRATSSLVSKKALNYIFPMDNSENKPLPGAIVPDSESQFPLKETLMDSLGVYGFALDLINGEDSGQSLTSELPSKKLH